MNPEVKKIGNKLFDKVELESQKVELALLDNLKSYTNGLKKYTDEGSGLQKLGERQKKELSDIELCNKALILFERTLKLKNKKTTLKVAFR